MTSSITTNKGWVTSVTPQPTEKKSPRGMLGQKTLAKSKGSLTPPKQSKPKTGWTTKKPSVHQHEKKDFFTHNKTAKPPPKTEKPTIGLISVPKQSTITHIEITKAPPVLISSEKARSALGSGETEHLLGGFAKEIESQLPKRAKGEREFARGLDESLRALSSKLDEPHRNVGSAATSARRDLIKIYTTIDKALNDPEFTKSKAVRKVLRNTLNDLKALDDSLQKVNADLKDLKKANVPLDKKVSLSTVITLATLPKEQLSDLARFGTRTEIPNSAKVLGSGQVNTVYKITYSDGLGSTTDRVFKPVDVRDPQQSGIASAIGIDPENPRYGERNICTHLMDKALGFGLIPETNFAIHDGKVGLVMELVGGNAPTDLSKTTAPLPENALSIITKITGDLEENKIDSEDFVTVVSPKKWGLDGKNAWVQTFDVSDKFNPKNPSLAMQLTKLQWLDIICGQADRNQGNFMIDNSDPEHVVVKGIDNDFSFGTKTGTGHPTESGWSNSYPGFPPLIDSESYNQIADMFRKFEGTGGMRESLSKNGLSGPEIDAAKERIELIFKAVEKGDVTVVETKRWNEYRDKEGNTASEILQKPSKKYQTYVGRLTAQQEMNMSMKESYGLL